MAATEEEGFEVMFCLGLDRVVCASLFVTLWVYFEFLIIWGIFQDVLFPSYQ